MYDTTNAESYKETNLHQKQESPASKTLRLKTPDATRASTAMFSDSGSPYRLQEPLMMMPFNCSYRNKNVSAAGAPDDDAF